MKPLQAEEWKLIGEDIFLYAKSNWDRLMAEGMQSKNPCDFVGPLDFALHAKASQLLNQYSPGAVIAFLKTFFALEVKSSDSRSSKVSSGTDKPLV